MPRFLPSSSSHKIQNRAKALKKKQALQEHSKKQQEMYEKNISFLKKYDLATELDMLIGTMNMIKCNFIAPLYQFLNYFSCGIFILYQIYLTIRVQVLRKKEEARKQAEAAAKVEEEKKRQEIIHNAVRSMHKRNNIQLCAVCEKPSGIQVKPDDPKMSGLRKLTNVKSGNQIMIHDECMKLVDGSPEKRQERAIQFKDKKARVYFLDKDSFVANQVTNVQVSGKQGAPELSAATA